jgi:hypothetical protein
MILFFDDNPNRAAIVYQRWSDEKRNKTVWTQTAAEAISVFKDYVGELEEAHLDHDLGGESFVNSQREDCGMEVVRFIEKMSTEDLQKLKSCYIIVHSWNLPAGRVMALRLQRVGLTAVHIPFGMPK